MLPNRDLLQVGQIFKQRVDHGVAHKKDPIIQIDIRVRNPQLLKKAAGHIAVIVLAGMDQAISQHVTLGVCRFQRIDDRRNFCEIWSSSGDKIDDFHARLPFDLFSTISIPFFKFSCQLSANK